MDLLMQRVMTGHGFRVGVAALRSFVKDFFSTCSFVLLATCAFTQTAGRQEIPLDKGWQSFASNANDDPSDYGKLLPKTSKRWKAVEVPHNWDAYEGYRRLLHGNRHGNCWYRKSFTVRQQKDKKRFFLYFEGVGSYASVYLNGKYAGEHAGGRTTFTIDVTDLIQTGSYENVLAVRAYHPANIKDLPWVCGGCSDERGFSEGSQPMGIFRPVHLIITSDIRIEPFGVHAWSDIQDDRASLSVNTTIKNYSRQNKFVLITNQLVDAAGKLKAESRLTQMVKPGDSIVVSQNNITVNDLSLWSLEDPYLYKIITTLRENDRIVDSVATDFGFRTINWRNSSNQFFLNGKPVFINGVAEYEHLLGQSHAFSNEQVLSRMNWLKLAGFNGFRDAHQPHNLLYGQLCNKMGVLWWTQLSAHVWYDSPAFRNNFKKLLREWVIERRNDPSVVLWGLQNESKLPEDFARECTELIRQLDPTTSSQRLVTTCNGGAGTDWDVPQNWTGTYGGDPNTYAEDVKKQVLIGEYGAWRTLDLHTEGGYVQNGKLSEDRMTQLMEKKIRLAESVKDSSAGHFFWLLTSHDNPGRVQGGEGLRELDRIGPVNYKGLLTPWEEPLDVFYMFRSNNVSGKKEPMVYIVSHTWPNRWTQPGIKDSITVYSNCDEVELFNDINDNSLGRKKRGGTGTHFQWNSVPVQYNVLYAVGYVNGKPMARDTIVLHHLPPSPRFDQLYSTGFSITRPQDGYKYLYRVNCGGADYMDENGNTWSADRPMPAGKMNRNNEHASPPASSLTRQYWGSISWTNEFPGMPAQFASQRRTFDPIKGTRDWKLFQDFRYGRDKLQYEFPLPAGEYLVEFYFSEPWLGIGGGMDCTGMRLFDVAVNNTTVLQNVDIWKEAGTNTVLKKTVTVKVKENRMVISFPRSRSGQAIIAAIAIASLKKDILPAPSFSLITQLSGKHCRVASWLDTGDKLFADNDVAFSSLPPVLFGADWLRFSSGQHTPPTEFIIAGDADVFVGISKGSVASWLKDFENIQEEIHTDHEKSNVYAVYRKRFLKNQKVVIGPGNTSPYLVMVKPVSAMQPAYDLKPVNSYRTNVAMVSRGITKEMFSSRECAVVKTNEQVSVQWPVQTGVADIYSITVKYFYPFNRELKGRLLLTGPGKTVLLDTAVKFTFTRPGKWNQFTVNTGHMINAGNYTVELMIENAEGLAVSGIEIQ